MTTILLSIVLQVLALHPAGNPDGKVLTMHQAVSGFGVSPKNKAYHWEGDHDLKEGPGAFPRPRKYILPKYDYRYVKSLFSMKPILLASEIDDSRPIWPQIKEQLMRDIVAGKYPMGSPFPTVRDLAEDAKVNRNTMQRALSELENEGLVITNRTSGRTVTMDENLIKLTRGKIAKEKIVSFRQEMEDMGFTMEEIISLMRGSDNEEKGE